MKPPVSLTKDELLRLLKVARDHSVQDWLMLTTTFWHGLRVSETLAITGNDVRDGYLTVNRLKGSDKTCQPLIEHPDPLLNYKQALELAAQIKPRTRLFSYSSSIQSDRFKVNYLMRKYGKLAGIPRHKCKPHALKHTCAVLMLGPEGKNVDKVRVHLGHKNLSSTGSYLQVTSEAAAKAMADSMGGSI